ncbi:hypothetical protein M514_12650 [Trichuris suis]|uniref:Uncharacterized protein n=1 Tax=Trichuris suis TaxID=68888 RepID=A0A085N3Q6_9BILA|nr:hypothetical protein M513_12650 [Trichuris suis]KFD64102.1 hypothetical protein M514_12650 [Trichuris suis]
MRTALITLLKCSGGLGGLTVELHRCCLWGLPVLEPVSHGSAKNVDDVINNDEHEWAEIK